MIDDLDDILGMAKAEAPDLPSDASMAELSVLVKELVDVRSRIERGEELLATLKKEELRLSNESVPSKMDEIGFTEVKLPDGRRVSYKPFYSGKIKPEREPEAFVWLEDNGHGGVIKGEVIVPYRRPQREVIEKLIKFIKTEFGLDPNIKLGVHHSTLRALFREVIEDEGETFPPELFDLFIGRKTTIK
jgi:hypothetical protein